MMCIAGDICALLNTFPSDGCPRTVYFRLYRILLPLSYTFTFLSVRVVERDLLIR